MTAITQIAFVALGFLLIYLKVTGTIAWAWVWVLAPFWVGAAFAVIIFAAIMIFALVVSK